MGIPKNSDNPSLFGEGEGVEVDRIFSDALMEKRNKQKIVAWV